MPPKQQQQQQQQGAQRGGPKRRLPDMDQPEDPTLLKMGGSTVLEPMAEDTIYGNMRLSDATAVLKAKAILKLGPENYRLVVLGLQGVALVIVVYVILRIIAIFRAGQDDKLEQRLKEAEERERLREEQRANPQQQQQGSSNSKKVESKKDATKAANRDAADEQQQQQQGGDNKQHTSSALSLTSTCKRTRKPTLSTPTSSLKGYDLVAVCQHSPCGNLLAVSERARRTFSVFAQHRNFVGTFKTTLNVNRPLDGTIDKPLITSAFFSPDGCYLAAYDVTIDSLLVMRNNTTVDGAHNEFQPSANVTVAYRMRLSDARELAPAPRGQLWGSQFACFFPGPSPDDRFYAFHNDGCAMLFNARTGAKVASAKKSLGNTVAWGVSDGLAACAGSTMNETCLYRIKVRDSTGGASISFDRYGPNFSPSGKRISHVYLTPDSSVLMMLPSDEAAFIISFLYNSTEIENGSAPKISIPLEDRDFLDPSLRSALKFECLHVAPNPTYPGKKVLFVVLRIGSDLVVYRVDCFEAMPQNSGGGSAPKVHRVLEVHGAHDDCPLIGAAIVGRGRGVVTATESDSRNLLKCWEMNNSNSSSN